jgi:hypothetical protein
MLKRIVTALALMAIFATASMAQWDNQGVFPAGDDTLTGSTHGLAVDPDGKVWVSNFYSDETIVDINTGDTVLVGSIKVFNPDGSEADFSPIKVAKLSEFESDTLYGNCRGMRTDVDGNILYVQSGPTMMYEFDYETGEAVNAVDPELGTSPTAPAVSEEGTIFVGPVVPGNPLKMFDQDFNFVGNALEATVGFSRAFEVSDDGNTIYWAGYTNGYVTVYERPDQFSSFDSVDTILEGFAAESFGWHPTSGNLWVSAGSGNDPAGMGYSNHTWYAYNPSSDAIVDSMKWDFVAGVDSANQRPRAIDFAPDGNTAYVGSFGTNSLPMMQKIEYVTSVEEVKGQMPKNYTLGENYPNPFNPTTNIKFSIPESGMVTMKVYNTVGQEVATLVQEQKSAGEYNVSFNAGNLPSGVYIYQIQVNDFTASKKMMLMK